MSNSSSIGTETPEFGIADVLVSRTDPRGVILAANEVFERVSGYPWEKLHNAPHKVIRHPDMPKGVFWLFWNTLQAGNPIGAFVKNRAADGRYYWVFACVAPLEEGYLSVRIKPQADVVALIETEYAALLKREQSEGLSPADSGAILLARIKELGFADYDAFMAEMISTQMQARVEQSTRSGSILLSDLTRLTGLWRDVHDECQAIFEAHLQIANTPANLRVQAAHLEDRGIPLSVIASNFASLAKDIDQMMDVFVTSVESVSGQIDKSRFLAGLEHLMREVVWVFQSEETEMAGIDIATEVALMQAQQARCFDDTAKGLRDAWKAVRTFSSIAEETAGVLSGLSVAKVMCEIEKAYLQVLDDSSIGATIGELDSFQSAARTSITKLRKLLFQIHRVIERCQGNITLMSEHQRRDAA